MRTWELPLTHVQQLPAEGNLLFSVEYHLCWVPMLPTLTVCFQCHVPKWHYSVDQEMAFQNDSAIKPFRSIKRDFIPPPPSEVEPWERTAGRFSRSTQRAETISLLLMNLPSSSVVLLGRRYQMLYWQRKRKNQPPKEGEKLALV